MLTLLNDWPHRWRHISKGRWWLPQRYQESPPWHWDFPTWQRGDADVFLPCEMGLAANGTCSARPSDKCSASRKCLLDSQSGFGSRRSLLCEGVGRYPRFRFANGREPLSLVDFALAFKKRRVKLLLIGDSLMGSFFTASGCHLARMVNVRHVASRTVYVNFTARIPAENKYGVKTKYSAESQVYDLFASQMRLHITYVAKNRVLFASSDIFEALCSRFDFVALAVGAHYEQGNETAAFIGQMVSIIELVKQCVRGSGTRVAFLSHPPHRFPFHEHGWYTDRGRKASECVVLINSTIERADWTTSRLREAVGRVKGVRLVPPRAWIDDTSPQSSRDVVALHWVPQFDVLFDVLGFNRRLWNTETLSKTRHESSHAGLDCLHIVFAPGLYAAAFDALALAALSSDGAGLSKPVVKFTSTPDAENMVEILHNFKQLDHVAGIHLNASSAALFADIVAT